jgi:hypothetical protein
VTAATNEVESFNRFWQWIGFGHRGVIAGNDPVEQEKTMKSNAESDPEVHRSGLARNSSY